MFLFSFGCFFFLKKEVQVNQGEDEYYKNQDVGVILSCLWVEHWEIIISSLPWVSSEQITGPASGNHLHTIQYDCTILRVPFLIMICSNLHLLSIYQKGEDFPLIWLTARLCVIQQLHLWWMILLCVPLCFVLPQAPFISTAALSKVREGWRCWLSQGWQLGAVLTCSLIKSSWARVHLWQGPCQAADRWEAVLNTNVHEVKTGNRCPLLCQQQP